MKMGSMDRAILTGFICRICSKMSRVVYHVFGEEGINMNLVMQIRNYFGVDIYCNDQLPRTVCSNCINKLKVHFEWMESIQRTQMKIQHKIRNAYKQKMDNSLSNASDITDSRSTTSL